MFMKLNGTYKFKANSRQVFNAILNPSVLQACIPGCSSVELLDPAHLMANITTPIPGLKGPFGVVVRMAQRQEPNYLTLEVNHTGIGGSVSASSQISLNDEADGSLLTYDASANLEGPVAIANNPIGQGITRNTLKTFFERLEKAIA
jgi:uncharacterized protein